MDISGIPDNTIFNAFVAQTAETQVGAPALGGEGKGHQHDLFIAAMHLYMSHLHQLVMDSWDRFSDSQKAISRKRDSDAKVRDKHHSEDEARRLEGQKRHIEAQLDAYGSELISCGIHRQAGKFRFFQGQHTDSSRHLHIPI